MTSLRVSLESLAGAIDLRGGGATVMIACLIDLQKTDDSVEVRAFKNGQAVLDLMNQLDRPDAIEAVVGLQLALPPVYNVGGSWEVVTVLDFARVTYQAGDRVKDVYAYSTASGRIFTDKEEVDKNKIINIRSIYRAANADSDNDPELALYQSSTSMFLTKFFNELFKVGGR